jgi:hypothetical protein
VIYWSMFDMKPFDEFFNYFYNDADIIDKVSEIGGFSASVINKVIEETDVLPFVFKDTTGVEKSKRRNPKWKELEKILAAKYKDNYVRYNVLRAKMLWAYDIGDNKKVAGYMARRLQQFPPVISDNPMVWEPYITQSAKFIFQNSKNRKELEEAVKWTTKAVNEGIENLALAHNDQLLDLNAILLYMVNKKDEAIKNEERAIYSVRYIPDMNSTYRQRLSRMKNGQPLFIKNDK